MSRLFHSYMGGFCKHCGDDLGYIEVDGGRTRQYCNDRCRKAASRDRSKTDTATSRNDNIRRIWDECQISGRSRLKLEEILVKFGPDAAKLATDAVWSALGGSTINW